MATYFTDDFADFSTDWTEQWNTAGTFAVTSGNLDVPAGVSGDWRGLSWNDIDSDGNRATVEVLALITTPSSLSTAVYPIFVRGAGADESATNYSVRISTSTFRTYQCSGTDTPTQVGTVSGTYSTSTDYWIRLRADGSSIKAKIWTGTAGDEPGTWDLDSTDATHATAGWAGVSQYAGTSGFTVKQFGVGTNGDTAPSSAGGGGATITGDSGSYTLTGTAATLKVGRKLTADSGTYSLTGTDVAFKRGYALSAESGTYTVSGTAVDLKAGRKLTADSGSYTLTGTDVTLNYSPAGSYNLTAESGSYALTGTAATLKVSRKLTADSGTYALTGTDVTLSKGVKLTADSGSYTLSGSNVAFSRTYVLTAESGAYTLTGTSAGLTWSGAPVVEAPTNGGPSIYGKPVFREKQFRKEYEEQVKRIEDEKRLARILREDEEITVIMALMAA